MYGTRHAAVAAPVLAYTGLEMGWYVTAAITMLFAGIALVSLVRRGNTERP